ncbi:MAG TPA: ABC transporter ATP-binding protein [Gemmatimonadaceae bacterium]|nr:ABC transporter ATP-binding protein [Gemmatimonadaceae bacterium]
MPDATPSPRAPRLAIETRNLRKEFGTQVAVRNLTLSVREGEIFGFLGPNGAGKSTSIKMLLGIVRPTAGEGTVFGAPIGDVAVRRHIGFLPEDFRFYEWLTALELLELHGRLAGMTTPSARARAPEVLELVGIAAHARRRLRGFSKGMLQRLGLAQALIHEPRILFLDEPTSGLDPMGRRLVRDIIRAQRDRGVTVFLNSHLLSEIEVTCDRVAFISNGEIVASRDLTASENGSARRIRIRARNMTAAMLDNLSAYMTTPIQPESRTDEYTFDISAEDVLPEIIRRLTLSGADLFQVSPEPTSLEDTFMRLVGEDRGL